MENFPLYLKYWFFLSSCFYSSCKDHYCSCDMGLRYFIGVECTYIRNCQSLVLSQTSMGQVSMLFLRRLFQKSHPLPCSTDLHASHRAYSGSSALPWRCSASQQSHSCPRCARGCGYVADAPGRNRHFHVFWLSVLHTSLSHDLVLSLLQNLVMRHPCR